MPIGDRTGPEGMGPMTGRRLGYCAGYRAPGFAQGIGWGGRGWGRGHGWHRGGGYFPPPYYPPAPAGDETEFLKQQASALEQELRDVQSRLKELEKSKKK